MLIFHWLVLFAAIISFLAFLLSFFLGGTGGQREAESAENGMVKFGVMTLIFVVVFVLT